MKRICSIIALSSLILLGNRMAGAQPPHFQALCHPGWASSDLAFTMSVALADIDDDGDLDLIAGNYNYPYYPSIYPFIPPNPAEPQLDQIGADLVAYKWDQNLSPPTFASAYVYTTTKRCIDCIAVAGYDNDSDLDIAIGVVAGKGNDGGVWVFKNQGGNFENLFVDDPDDQYTWHNEDGSYDAHCVRWVDYDCDGDLDLAALEVGGTLRIYQNGPNGLQPTPVTYGFGPGFPLMPMGKGPSQGGFGDDLSEEAIDYQIRGTTMEFGDMDGDGDLDVFINVDGYPRVYKNRYGVVPVYSSDYCWEVDGFTLAFGKNNMSCASFGFIHQNEPATPETFALAIGSFRLDLGTPADPISYRNEVYILYGEALRLVWQSAEYQEQSPQTQLVTDIQWARLSGAGDPFMDLVTASYPACLEVGSNYYPTWIRGQEYYYTDPQLSWDPINPQNTQVRDWANDTNDRSTSLALGDIAHPDSSHEPNEVIHCWHDGEPVSIAYLHNFPAYDVASVKWSDDGNEPQELGNYDWCVDLVNGWISINRDFFDAHPNLPNFYLHVDYSYSDDYDLAIGNDGKNAVYFNAGGMGVAYDPGNTHKAIRVNDFATRHTYNPNDFGINPSATELNLMAPDGLGTAEYSTIGLSQGPTPLDDYLPNHPNIRRIGLAVPWALETLQGHYLWDWHDKYLNELCENDRETFIYEWHGTGWIYDDWRDYPSLHAMFIRNLVNRYRPNGVLAEAWPSAGYNWGDWGATIYQMANEPNITYRNRDFGPPEVNDPLIDSVAAMIYQNYQMIKEIQEQAQLTGDKRLFMASPNWGSGYGPSEEHWQDPYWSWLWNKYGPPPMPYLNMLNKSTIGYIDPPSNDLYDRVLWQYCDYICQQAYLIFPHRDPFALAFADQNNQLKLGVEQFFWSYYTEGMQDYLAPPAGTPPHDFTPVMRISPGPSATYSEHPFLVHEWTYELDYWGLPDEGCPKADFTAAEIAELFTVDVFPTDPNRDHRLVRYDLGWMGMYPSYENLFEVCAGFLNDPNPDDVPPYTHIHLELAPQGSPMWTISFAPADDPDVYEYIFHHDNPNAIPAIDRYAHFTKTWWEGNGQESNFVHENPLGWNYKNLKLTYAYGYPDLNPRVDCYTASGAQFQKEVEWNTVPPTDDALHFEAGEMGPAMLMVNENNPAPQAANAYDQTVQLHPGWNLVSWHIEPLEPDIYFAQILPMWIYDPPDPPVPTWFNSKGGKLYKWNDNILYYPQWYQSEVWHLDYAYYIWMDAPHIWDQFQDKERFPLGQITINPSGAWDDSLDTYANYPDQVTNGWFFMGYSAPGLCKLATVYDQWPPPNGLLSGQGTYHGPFHWLYWENNQPAGYPHYDWNEQYLVMVKTDDGKIYLPYDPDNPRYPHAVTGPEYDEIGVLEPGRGYFLGFRQETASMPFAGWQDYPGWDALPPPPSPTPPQTASAGHFQYQAYTHWCYPVFIDTVDLQVCPMTAGDQIAVFDGEMCVGAAVYNGEFPLKITCWKDDIATPDTLDGYLAGHEMTFVWFDASENQEVTFVPPPGPMAVQDDPIAPTHSGFGAGVYGVRSMVYGVQSLQQLPQAYKLGQNFPNPFNAETVIPLELPQRSKVRLEIFNVKGQKIAVLFEGIKESGWEKVRYNAAALPSGIYFYRITAEGLERGGKFVDVGKMLVLK